jgi:hypothetical protein
MCEPTGSGITDRGPNIGGSFIDDPSLIPAFGTWNVPLPGSPLH